MPAAPSAKQNVASARVSPTAAHRIAGTSQMAVRTREYPWESTALGPIAGWPDSLVSTVNFVLALPLSTILMVGPELITLYNDAYISTLAERHPQALGMRGNVLWADAWAAVGGQIEEVLATGVYFKNENMLIPVERNGVLTDTWFTYTFSPMFHGNDGTVAGVVCMAQDVTIAHRAMLDLAESERKLSVVARELNQMMAATTDAVVSIDRDWKFTYLNPAAERAYALGRQLIGRVLWDEFPDTAHPDSPFFTHYQAAMHESQASTFEAYYPQPLDVWVRLAVFPTDDGIVTFSRNITDERKTAAVLLQTEKLAAVGRLASAIAHEINNPLEAVTNLLYIARSENDLAEVQRLLHTADDELRRVSAIANQTLAFHKQSTRPREVRCQDLFDGSLTLYRSKLLNARIQAETRARCVRGIVVYEGEIRQVLNNLIGNAIDAMPRGGRLRLRSRTATDLTTGKHGIRITVADTGTGIEPEKAAKVFDAFFTTKGIGGTGLGLWISKDILSRHGGTMHFRSSRHAAHHGTVFTVFLPFQNAAVQLLRV